MATVINIHKNDTKEIIQKKLDLIGSTSKFLNLFNAKKFTGKIKSFQDGLEFQRNLRNEWN